MQCSNSISILRNLQLSLIWQFAIFHKLFSNHAGVVSMKHRLVVHRRPDKRPCGTMVRELVLRTHPRFFARHCVRLVIIAAVAVCGLAPVVAAKAASYAGIVMDAKTGKVLYGHREDARQGPASLTKMMTLYLLFEAMENGEVSKKTRIKVSKHAASMPPSKLGIPAGGSVSAEQAILSLVTKSANDIAAAVGEHLGGTESGFAKKMTAKARALGMGSTTFRNASGLPNSSQLTTARDMAILGVALREHFPQYYGYFSTRVFAYGKKRMGNHNRLLGQVKGMDGIKTGYTKASGFNLVSSVERDGRSIVAVVLGGKSGKARNEQMATLIERHISKASRGGDNLIVAKVRNRNPARETIETAEETVVADATVQLPMKRPAEISRLKSQDPVAERIATAHTVSAASLQADTKKGFRDGSDFDIAAIEAKLRSISARNLPIPSPAPSSGPTDPIMTAASKEDKIGKLALMTENASPAEQAIEHQIPAGWQIQIGAAPSLGGANQLLETARAKAPKTLSSVRDHTETVSKGDATLYRARFAGFASKEEAWSACDQLKKKKFACIALSN